MGIFAEYNREPNWKTKDYYNGNSFGLDQGYFQIYTPNKDKTPIDVGDPGFYQDTKLPFELGDVEIPWGIGISQISPEGNPIIGDNMEKEEKKPDWILNPQWPTYSGEDTQEEDVENQEPEQEPEQAPSSQNPQTPEQAPPPSQKPTQQQPSQQPQTPQQPPTQQQKPTKSERENAELGNNTYTKSPLYKWDGVNKIPKSLHKTVKNFMGFYQKKGIPAHIAAAIIGNMMVESTLSTVAVNKYDLGSSSTGLIQWKGDRFTDLKNFAESKGRPWDDVSVQLEFVLYEMQHNPRFKKDYQNLMNSKTPAEASEAFAHYNTYAGFDGTIKTARLLIETWMKEKGWSRERAEKEAKKFIVKKHKERQCYAQEVYWNWKY